MCARARACVCVCVTYSYCLIGDNGRLQYLRSCLFEIYVSVGFAIRCLYSAVSLTLVREQSFIRISYYYDSCIIACKVTKIFLLGLPHKVTDMVASLLIFHKFLLLPKFVSR